MGHAIDSHTCSLYNGCIIFFLSCKAMFINPVNSAVSSAGLPFSLTSAYGGGGVVSHI